MKFRLTYEGELRPTQGEARPQQREPLAAHKHRIRRHFHGQMKRLWQTEPFLSTYRVTQTDITSRPRADTKAYWGADPSETRPWDMAIADLYRENGYRFVPLVRDSDYLLCSLDILFLRRDSPGSLIHAGDIDNRLKTVIDALRKPSSPNELVGLPPEPGEDPFYCLMEDDRQVSQLSVETDVLLDPFAPGADVSSTARLVISVTVRPYYNTMLNAMF